MRSFYVFFVEQDVDSGSVMCWVKVDHTMVLWHVIALRITGPLWGESIVHGWFPSQRPVMRILDVFVVVIVQKLLNKHVGLVVSDAPTFMWRHCDVSKRTQKTHPIARLWEREMGCFSWTQHLTNYFRLLLLLCSTKLWYDGLRYVECLSYRLMVLFCFVLMCFGL